MKIAAFVALAGIAAIASAQSLSVSSDMASYDANAGDTVTVEIYGSWSDFASAQYASGFELSATTASGFATAASATLASWATTAPATQTNGSDFTQLAGGQFAAPAIGIPPNGATTSSPVLLATLSIDVSAAWDGSAITYTIGRTIGLDPTNNGFSVADAATGFVISGDGAVSGQVVPVSYGTFTIVPTPASAALLGLGGLAAARRRR